VPAGPLGGSVEVVTEALAVVGGVVVEAVVGAGVVGAPMVAAGAVVGALVSVPVPLLQLAAISPNAAPAARSQRPPFMP
jgi:hypothetical protein